MYKRAPVNRTARLARLQIVVLALLGLLAAATLAPSIVLAQDDESESPARIDVMHLVADGPAVDVWIDDEIVLEAVEPGMNEPITGLEAGAYTLSLMPAGDGEPLIGPVPLTLEGGHRYTVASMGQAAEPETLDALVIDETAEMEGADLANNTYRIIINNIAGSPPISFYEEDRFLERDLEYGDYASGTVEPFSWDTGRAVAGDDIDEIVFPFDLEDDGLSGYWEPYTVYVFGMMGSYPGEPDSDYYFAQPHVYTVAPDLVTLLRSFSPWDLTFDSRTFMRFDTFSDWLEETGVDARLAEGGPYTIFAPTDRAVDALSGRKVAALTDDLAALEELVLNHIVEGALDPAILIEGGVIETMAGNEIEVHPSTDEGLSFGLGDDVDAYTAFYEVGDGITMYPLRNQILALPAAAADAADDEETAAEEPVAVESPDPVAVVEEFVAALNEGDAEAALAFVADDAVLTSVLGEVEGKDAIGALIERMVDAGATVEVENLAADGDRVTYDYAYYFRGDLLVSGDDGVAIVKDGSIVFNGTEATAPE